MDLPYFGYLGISRTSRQNNASLSINWTRTYPYLLEHILLFLGGERQGPLLGLTELGRLLVELLLPLLQSKQNINHKYKKYTFF